MNLLERLPHLGPMRFIDEVVSVDDARIETRSIVRSDHILARDGAISPLAAIEYFAQAAALLMVHRTRASDTGPMAGALLGARTLELDSDRFEVGDELRAIAEEVLALGELARFECVLLRNGEKVARAAINVAATRAS
jgi:predicted hotdog family 3-hydroxylacyl-ACP dehydratase